MRRFFSSDMHILESFKEIFGKTVMPLSYSSEKKREKCNYLTLNRRIVVLIGMLTY